MFPRIFVRGVEIERVYSYRCLGLIIDHRMRWNNHVTFIKSRIRPFFAVLRKSASLVPDSNKLSLYCSAIHWHFLYLISIWGSTGITRLQELEPTQNKAIRYMFWREYCYDGLTTNDLFKKYRILKIQELVKYESNFPLNSELNVRTLRRESFLRVTS